MPVMERALGFIAAAERALENCSSCLLRDLILSEVQAVAQNRSTGEAPLAGKIVAAWASTCVC